MKNKKIFAIILAMCCLVLVLAGCDNSKDNEILEQRTFSKLSNDKVLVLSNGNRLMNHSNVDTQEVYLTKTVRKTYSLNRTYSHYNNDEKLYEYSGYYYYWTIQNQTDEEFLGNKTVQQSYSYSYLIYGEDEYISVKSKIKTETTFDYSEKWLERDFDVTIELNNYFENSYELKEAIPQLYEDIDLNNMNKYYVDVTVPTTNEIQVNTYSDFYYLETI